VSSQRVSSLLVLFFLSRALSLPSPHSFKKNNDDKKRHVRGAMRVCSVFWFVARSSARAMFCLFPGAVFSCFVFLGLGVVSFVPLF
jgi:hypothetical protein